MQSARSVGKSEGISFVILVLVLTLACLLTGRVAAQNYPFGSHVVPYAAGILPANSSQAELDAATAAFYDQWKAGYLRPACTAGQYKVLFPGGGTVSEAHGYGMVILAIMAGYEPDAQTYFDGMYRYYHAHPSDNNPLLMAWNQGPDCRSRQGVDSATDGDLDIAFALLLADNQWGSDGDINYRQAALDMIDAILNYRSPDINPVTGYPLLGDWASPGDSHYYGTRPSDFMPDHFLAFWSATGDDRWLSTYSGVLGLLGYMQATYSPDAGLIPDFVVNTQTGNPTPAPPNFLEGATDGAYSYNSCRVPMRIGMNYLVTGDPAAQAVLAPINQFFRSTTGDNPARVVDGYNLNGSRRSGTGFSLAFLAPLGVGAMSADSGGPGDQAWLDGVWAEVLRQPVTSGGYYENTLKLLSMIAMSGNWWLPQ